MNVSRMKPEIPRVQVRECLHPEFFRSAWQAETVHFDSILAKLVVLINFPKISKVNMLKRTDGKADMTSSNRSKAGKRDDNTILVQGFFFFAEINQVLIPWLLVFLVGPSHVHIPLGRTGCGIIDARKHRADSAWSQCISGVKMWIPDFQGQFRVRRLLDGALDLATEVFMLVGCCSPWKLDLSVWVGVGNFRFGALDILDFRLDGDFGRARDGLLREIDGQINLLRDNRKAEIQRLLGWKGVVKVARHGAHCAQPLDQVSAQFAFPMPLDMRDAVALAR
ncbi:hypothetical protein KCV05_g92, partial [Aureobasidium melanogenum]